MLRGRSHVQHVIFHNITVEKGSKDVLVRGMASHCWGPGSISGPGVTCEWSLLFVMILAPKVFSESSGFPPSTKTNILNSDSTWRQWKKKTTLCIDYKQSLLSGEVPYANNKNQWKRLTFARCGSSNFDFIARWELHEWNSPFSRSSCQYKDLCWSSITFKDSMECSVKNQLKKRIKICFCKIRWENIISI